MKTLHKLISNGQPIGLKHILKFIFDCICFLFGLLFIISCVNSYEKFVGVVGLVSIALSVMFIKYGKKEG